MDAHTVIEALFAIVVGISGFQLARLSNKVDDLMVAMEKRVTFDDFSKKSNFLHEKFNTKAEDHGERIAVLENEVGVKRHRKEKKPSTEE